MSEDGWIEWWGGRRPLPAHTLVEIRTRYGVSRSPERADVWRWGWTGKAPQHDIIAYRIVEESNG